MDSMTTAQVLPYIVPLLVLALVVRRALRSRTLKMEQLWVFPAVLIFVAGSVLIHAPVPGPVTLVGLVVALAVGGFIGWYRGRWTQITIDPQTHVLSSQGSIASTILIAVVFGVRYALEMAVHNGGMGPLPLNLHLDVAGITDGLMFFLVAMMSVQRIEMYLRCRKLLEEARGGGIVS